MKLKFKKNKKGVMGIILFFLVLFTIAIIGFAIALVVPIITYVSGEITPVMEGLGMAGNTNLSEASEYSFGTADKVANMLPILSILAYVSMLVFSIVIVVSYRYNPNPVFLGVYFMLAILLIFGCIILSNMYEDIYEGNDFLGEGLKENQAMSYLIIYSPLIMGVITFITGIYMFAGKQTESQGGFDI